MNEDSEDKAPRDVPIPIEVITNSNHNKSNDKNNSNKGKRETSVTSSNNDDKAWSFLKHITGEPVEVAHLIVKDGPSVVLSRVPYASFGALMTADRKEIEGFRAITNLVSEYAKPRTSLPKPLSIGVFGPPGAGKSFSLKQVVKGVLKTDLKTLEYNLSQFTNYSELISAFHSVQASAISGRTPLVLFDEFDSNFGNQPLGWLRYFLAPMENGNFQITATCILWAGVSAKGPDSVSRLRGYVDIRGPDPDPYPLKDQMYPIRRAMLLRALLKEYPGLNEGSKVNIDDSLLHGLLTISRFRHSARSMEAILAMSTLSEGTRFALSDLPSEDQLNLHVNSGEFLECVRRRELPTYIDKEEVAEKLHVEHKKALDKYCTDDNKEIRQALQQVNKSWTSLGENYKQSYRLQADEIPYKLRTIKYYLARKRVPERQPIGSLSTNKRTELGRLEHERFISQELHKKSLYGPGNILPRLIPWDDLGEPWRDVYEEFVDNIPKGMDLCEHPVYDLQQNGVQVLAVPT
ncbi:uncharacterized protein BDW43DRAFT_317017 [Aspergillus alliaceus]|uniref:uncharacterized protein n=1 Tax=Petromyces alliaceus TaxID=209559 RepID=UPI0012A52C1E|nr:uncharacterized protein BDW43DRAFT_317017 [Aspergillus alliaceus]KAB8227222.1 hypothetical protein BDW43DRAFT_317017 [Aspergillus alliaceus]